MNYIDINLLASKTPLARVSDPFGGKVSAYQIHKKRQHSKTKKTEKPIVSRLSRMFSRMSMALLGMGVLSAGVVSFPQVSEYVDQKLSSGYVQVFSKPIKDFGDNLVATGDKKIIKNYQPMKDVTLSHENRLIIDEIGVDAKLNESVQEDVEEALRSGVWRVSEFGTPYARKRPTIMAAHRFGFLEWTNEFRKNNSFYNLPKLEVGDSIEVIWGQRRYVYEVYAVEEGVEITDYRSDLILYTCKFLDADTRIFVYSKLLEI